MRSHPWHKLKLPMLALFVVLNGLVKIPMALSQQKSPSWQDEKAEGQRSRGAEEKPIQDSLQIPSSSNSLPCIDSGKDCVDKLTESAIAKSNKLKQIEEKIALIDDRLKVVGSRIDYSHKKSWTNYVTIDPVKLLQNLFGGGDVQKDKIAIADLEVKAADLEAALAELERQKEEEKVSLSDRVLHLLLDYEAASRRHELLTSQLETLNQQREVSRIAYKFGQGNTSQILGMEDRRDRTREQIIEVEIKRDEAVRELIQLISYQR
jgi:hypothetical protein